MSERQFIRLGALKFLICSFIYSVGAAEPLLVVGDPIIPVGEIIGSNSSYPAAEGPGNVLDGNSNTKYLNFGRLRSGFIVTPSAGSSVGRAFTISTANDFEGRDPVNWELFGTNEAVITVAHQSGFGREPRTLIANGTLSLPVDREIAGSQVIFNNNDAFTFYKWICRSMKDTAENSLQFSEFQFDCDPTLHQPPLGAQKPTLLPNGTQIQVDWTYEVDDSLDPDEDSPYTMNIADLPVSAKTFFDL